MFLLPIVQRELLVSSRRWTTFWARTAAAALAFVILLAVVPAADAVLGVHSGQRLFRLITNCAWFIIFFAGGQISADCLSRERREGTLGLLFLTNLKGYDVVLGKLTAKSITAFFCLFATLPVLAVPLLMGGVTAGEFCRTSAVLVVTLILSLSTGMAASVLFKDARNAGAVTFFSAFLIWCAGTIMPELGIWSLDRLSPFAALRFSNAGRFSTNPASYFVSIGTTLAASALLLVLASWMVGRTWQTRAPRRAALRRIHTRRELSHGTAESRANKRRRLLDINPILWLHSRNQLMRRTLTTVWILLVLGAFCLNCNRHMHWVDVYPAVSTMLFLHILFYGLLSVEAASYLSGIREDGAMEFLLSTPLSPRDIFDGQMLAAKRMFRVPFAAMMFYQVAWLCAMLTYAPARVTLPHLFGMGMTIILLSGYHTVIVCATAASVSAKRSVAPSLAAFSQVVLLPALFAVAVGAAARELPASTTVFALVTLSLLFHWFGADMARTRLRETTVRELLSGTPPAHARVPFDAT